MLVPVYDDHRNTDFLLNGLFFGYYLEYKGVFYEISKKIGEVFFSNKDTLI